MAFSQSACRASEKRVNQFKSRLSVRENKVTDVVKQAGAHSQQDKLDARKNE
jgi:hypothetical protein